MSKKWSYLQSAEIMDVGRYFEYNTDALNQFTNWLSFLQKPKQEVLEIGSGSGYFTNILVNLFPEIELTCLEYDEEFIQVLKKRFDQRVKLVNEAVETTTLQSNAFDCSLSHIVIHNLVDPIIALTQMTRVVKPGGKVVVIEPLPASRNYYPSEKIEAAFDFLDKVKIYKCIEWSENSTETNTSNPWNYCYPQFFEKVGLKEIECHGWTSVFTLSDPRIEFEEKKKWLQMRDALIKNTQEETTKILLANDQSKKDIENAYRIINKYHKDLLKASQSELSKIHEQEIVHRIIVVGTKA